MENKQGKNLKILRESSNETIKELLEYLKSVAKDDDRRKPLSVNSVNTVAQWENGSRAIPYDILVKLSEHYMVTLEDFSNSDMEPFRLSVRNFNLFAERLDVVFPVVAPDDYSDETCCNPSFRKAVDLHCRILTNMKSILDRDKLSRYLSDSGSEETMALDLDPGLCVDEYIVAFNKHDEYLPYIACNRLSLFYLRIVILVMLSVARKLPVGLFQDTDLSVSSLDTSVPVFSVLKDTIDNADGLLRKSKMPYQVECLINSLYGVDGFQDLVDYFNAFRYILCVVDNSDGFARNCKTGLILMDSYAKRGNLRAQYFLGLCVAAMNE